MESWTPEEFRRVPGYHVIIDGLLAGTLRGDPIRPRPMQSPER